MFSIEAHRVRIARLCSEMKVSELALVGSAARGELRPESDVDFLVEFSGSERLFDRYFALKEGLEKALGRPVDVVMKGAVRNPIIRDSILCDRIPFYAA